MNHVGGFAFAGPEVREKHEAAYKRARDLFGEGKAFTAIRHGYNENSYQVDPERTKGLSLLEKLTLVNGGPLPFGGALRGAWYVIYTD